MKTHHPLPAALLTLLLLLAASWSWAATAPKPESPPLAEAESYRDPLTGMEFIKIQGGSFQMGSPEAETDHHSDEKLHWVSVGSFWLGKHEVTVSQFRRFVNATGYRTDAKRNDDSSEGCFSEKTKDNFGYMAGRSWKDPGFRQGDDHPVLCVSWNDAVAYAEWLSKETGKTYRLPTEAEWEYAARAGTETARFWGDSPDRACRYANVADRTAQQRWSNWSIHDCTDGYTWTAPVGSFETNPWGLHDMLGNVLEWTCSTYDVGYGGGEKRCAGQGDSGQRAFRGGGWLIKPARARSAHRLRNSPTFRYGLLGFRLLQD